MKSHRLVIALTAINFAILMVLLARVAIPPAAAEGDGVLRGRGLEIVDGGGRVRASLSVLPASTAPDGTAISETVLLRLINADGQPSVKVAAGATAAGLSFVGGDDQSYVVLQADGPKSSLKLVEPDGRETTIGP